MEAEFPRQRPNVADAFEAGQQAYWNGPASIAWVTLQDRLDAVFAPVTQAALARAAPGEGEHVLDIGCGCGATVLELARHVGPEGHVHGVDISAPMLARAHQRAQAEGLAQVTLSLADAATLDFAPGVNDLVFSRLGIMFFDDPVAAFTNLRRALKPGGRLVVVCCRTARENRYITMAVQAARPLLPPEALMPAGPGRPGMFSLAEPTELHRILTGAGFGSVELVPHDVAMRLGGPGEARAAAEFSLQFGPLTRVLDTADDELRAKLVAAVADAYQRIETADGILLEGAFWFVEARA